MTDSLAAVRVAWTDGHAHSRRKGIKGASSPSPRIYQKTIRPVRVIWI